ncbi:MAG: hypothetical protein ACFCD0_15600 [Gemmataceae bacterium]
MSELHLFVAYGHHGLRMSSANGREWSEPVLGDRNHLYRDGAFGGGRFVVVGSFGARSITSTSQDGTQWSEPTVLQNDPPPYLSAIQHGGDKYVAVGGYSPDVNLLSSTTSENGSRWPRIHTERKRSLTSITYGNGKFVAAGVRGMVVVSQDGSTWREAEGRPARDTFIAIAFGNNVFVGTGLHGLRMTSRDGLTWTNRQVGEEGEHINSVVWTGEEFVGVGLGATYFSPDGRRWRRVRNTAAPLRCSYGNNVYVGTHWRGKILVSADAIRWRQVHRSEHHVTGFVHGRVRAR